LCISTPTLPPVKSEFSIVDVATSDVLPYIETVDLVLAFENTEPVMFTFVLFFDCVTQQRRFETTHMPLVTGAKDNTISFLRSP
jgi:hypothetical protein